VGVPEAVDNAPRHGRSVADGRVEAGDLLAAAVGVKPDAENLSRMRRRIKIAAGKPVGLRSLFADERQGAIEQRSGQEHVAPEKISTTGRAAGITPFRRARSTIPNVPMTGTPKAAAHLRPARSSMTARLPGSFNASATTALSPGPSPHCVIAAGGCDGSMIASRGCASS
jgi:hypothetical protein